MNEYKISLVKSQNDWLKKTSPKPLEFIGDKS